MAGSNLFMNWVGVTVAYTPPGGVLTTIALGEVTDIEPDAATKHEIFYGDARRFARAIVATERKRSLSISSGDAAKLLAIPESVPCTVTGTLLDAVSQSSSAGSGSIQVVLVNAMREHVSVKGANNKFANNGVKFEAYGDSADNDPLSITVL